VPQQFVTEMSVRKCKKEPVDQRVGVCPGIDKCPKEASVPGSPVREGSVYPDTGWKGSPLHFGRRRGPRCSTRKLFKFGILDANMTLDGAWRENGYF